MLLIIEQNSSEGISLSLAFSYMGILAKAVKPPEARFELSPLYRAVLVKDPEALPDPYDFVHRLRSYGKNIPFFAVSDDQGKYKELFGAVFPSLSTASEIAAGIIKASELLGLEPIGEYMLAGIDASCTLVNTEYFFKKIKLTAKENMILRFLIRAYPVGKSSCDILNYAFSPSKMPEPSAVRTHISSINKKFKAVCGRRLISAEPGRGYVIITPELSEEKEKISIE